MHDWVRNFVRKRGRRYKRERERDSFLGFQRTRRPTLKSPSLFKSKINMSEKHCSARHFAADIVFASEKI